MRFAAPLTALLLLTVALAGCTDNTDDAPVDQFDDTAGEVEVSQTRGGIRGVVVDGAIRPIEGATVRDLSSGFEVTTDASGAFQVGGLRPGAYEIEASHPLYDTQQQNVEVIAGVERPPVVKFQLTRLISEEPYMQLEKHDGFISCSANIFIPEYPDPGAGPYFGGAGLLSEECGEGVGMPSESPVLGGERIGKATNNAAQTWFELDGGFIETLIVEQVFEPSTEGGNNGLHTRIATNWLCDPVCGGDQAAIMDGLSPLRAEIPKATMLENNITITDEWSTFSWASANATGVLLNQEYEVFVAAFYYLPAPEGWSFVRGDPNPYLP